MLLSSLFFVTDRATTDIYTLSLHDALPISQPGAVARAVNVGEHTESREMISKPSQIAVLLDGSDRSAAALPVAAQLAAALDARSEEHTSELQSLTNLVCRLLLEKKKQKKN